MPKKWIILDWEIMWLSKLLYPIENRKWRRWYHCECLNCWNEFDKCLDDLKRKDRPRTCWKCKYYKWETRTTNKWTIINWYEFIEEQEQSHWNRRCLVKTFDWIIKNVSYSDFLNWRLKKEKNPITKHWMHNTRFYKIYRSMLDRCNNIKNIHFIQYWWRWIKCKWDTFDDFKKDMYESYLDHCSIKWEYNTTIDRINVDWNYYKENCRWATRYEQSNNRRVNIVIPDEFKWKTLIEILNEFWINRSTFYWRLKRWESFEEALY